MLCGGDIMKYIRTVRSINVNNLYRSIASTGTKKRTFLRVELEA